MIISDCTKSPIVRNEVRPEPDLVPVPQDRFEPGQAREPVRKPAAPDPSGPLTQLAAHKEEQSQDWQSAREILARVEAARKLTDQRIMAIMADLSTQIFSLWQEVMARRRKACDEALARWSKLMFE